MKDKLAKGVLWLGAAKLVINLLALFSTLVMARFLTPEDFGLVALANTMLLIISSVTELSLASALIHHEQPSDVHFHTAWTLNLIRAVAVGLVFCAFGPVAVRIYHEPRLLGIMFALGVSVAMAGFNNPKTVVFTRDLIFWQEFALTVSQKFAGFLVGVTLAIIYKSYWALVGGTLASQLLGIIVSYAVIPFKPKFSISHTRELWSFSIWLTWGKIVNTLNWKLDHLLIGGYIGPRALGYYTVGDNFAGMVTRETIGPLETALFPGFRQIAHDNTRLKNAYRSAQALTSAIALPLGVGFALVAHSLVLLAMGAKWMPVAHVIQMLACVFALQTLSSPVHPLAMAKGETRLLFYRDLLGFVIRVPIIVLGLLLGGLLGILYARSITGVIAVYINMHMVRRLIGTGLIDQLQANVRSLISVLIMAAGVLLLEYVIGRDGGSLDLAIKVAAFTLTGGIIYVGTHWVLWVLAAKPMGPEREVMKVVSKVLAKLKKPGAMTIGAEK